MIDTPSITTPRSISIVVERAPDPVAPPVLPCHDLRKVGLATATDMLQAKVADLDVVFLARARADVRCCPYCSRPHPG